MIAATNRNLEEEVEEKNFRSDLYYRLQAFTIQLPPLRTRRSDILPLAEYFLARFAARNGPRTPGLSEDAIVALQQYPFPGNVRELEHMMDRAAIRTGGRPITAGNIQQVEHALSTEKSSLSISRLPANFRFTKQSRRGRRICCRKHSEALTETSQTPPDSLV